MELLLEIFFIFSKNKLSLEISENKLYIIPHYENNYILS